MVLRRCIILFITLALVIFFIIQYKDKKSKTEQDVYKEDELISRNILFDNPEKIAVKISEDGSYISFIAPLEGVLNIWVAEKNNISAATAITDDNSRGIRSYFWAKDNKHIIYTRDKNGDENWHLYSVNIETKEQKELTPIDGAKASVLKTSRNRPNEILVLINDRVAEYFDIYNIDITTGQREPVYKNTDNYSSFYADDNFNIRLAYKMLPSGVGDVYIFKDNDLSNPSLFMEIPAEDMLTTGPLHISSDGNKLFAIDSTETDTSSLVQFDLVTGDKEVIYNSSKADINDYLVNTKTKVIQAVAIDYTRKIWSILDKSLEPDLRFLKTIDEGDVEIVSRTYEDDEWIVASSTSDSPHNYYLYNRADKKAEFLFSSNSKQAKQKFAKMYPFIIKASDGMELISYVTIPRWLDNGNGIPIKPVPLVLYVHGGPNARDSWGFSPVVQWLANRGYAVLNVNYRGSVGFGKDFINAGDGQWAKKMQTDLEEAVQWCVDNKITEADKVIIMGGSYGGYATLVGMAMTPDKYLAGIDIVGPSNLETLLKSIPPYWKPHIAHLNKIIGANTETDEGKEFLKSISPLTYANNIKKPLLIVQGANDPRVKQAESDQIAEAMKKHGIPVVYLLYPDEGHGLVRPENKLSMYAHAELFLANFAGGRFMPHDNDFPGSTIKVVEGKDITWTTRKDN